MRSCMRAIFGLVGLGLVQNLHAASPPPDGAAPPTAQEFARAPQFDELSLSPDGKHLAASVRNRQGKRSMVIFALPSMTPTYGLQFAGEEAVAEFNWVSNERVIVAVGWQESPTERPGRTGELFAVNIDGKQASYLFGYQGSGTIGTLIRPGNEAVRGFADFVSDIEGDPEHALVTMSTATTSTYRGRYFSGDYATLYRINVFTGRRTEVARAPTRQVQGYYTSAAGVPRLFVGTGEESSDSLIFWRTSTGQWQPVPLPVKGTSVRRLSRDGTRGYFITEPKPDQRCLIEMTLPEQGEPQQKPLLCKPPNEARRFFFDRDGRPYGYRDSDRGRLQLLGDPPLEGRVLLSLEEQFPEQIVSLASRSRDGNKLMYFVHSDRNSGEYYLYDRATGQAAFFEATRTWLDPERLSPMKSYRYKARDGLEIDAYVTVPKGREAKNLPMVVMPHGGPIGIADGWGFDQEAQFLASRGYAVLQMNFRGSGGRGETFERLGYGEWGGKMIDDITDGARWAVQQGFADPKRLCISGASYGGYAALMSAVREPELYRCAVGFAGVYDLNRQILDTDGSEYRSSRLFFDEAIGKTKEARAAQSPVTHIDRLKAAVMIVHGKDDIRVPVNQAEILRDALDDRKIAYEWMIKRNEGHGFSDEKNVVEFYERLAAFLDKHIGVRAEPAAVAPKS